MEPWIRKLWNGFLKLFCSFQLTIDTSSSAMGKQESIQTETVVSESAERLFINDDGFSTSNTSSRIELIEQFVKELRSSLYNSKVLLPESEGYANSIKRWSDAVEMKAVREA